MSQDRRAVLFGLGAVALWSTLATACKLASRGLSPLELIEPASLVSWGFFAALVRWKGELREATQQGRRPALWAGLLNPVSYHLARFGTCERLPGQEAMALTYTWALTMAVRAVPVLGQQLTRTDVAAMAVAYAGA